jgi:hypothetical protein
MTKADNVKITLPLKGAIKLMTRLVPSTLAHEPEAAYSVNVDGL